MSGMPEARIPPAAAPRPSGGRRRLPRPVVIGLAALGGLFLLGTLPRLSREAKIHEEAHSVATALPVVTVVYPRRAVETGVIIPGNIEGGQQTTIQARTSGYVKQIYVDIGSRVRAGQLLAEIASPDVDQQVAQAQAQAAQAQAGAGQAQSQLSGTRAKVIQAQAAKDAAQAAVAHARQQLQVQVAAVAQQKAQVALAQVNYHRSRQLLAEGFVPKGDTDQAYTTLKTAQANLVSAQAAVNAARADIASAEHNVAAAQAVITSSQANVQADVQNVQAARSAVTAGKANAQRYEVLRSFSRVTAPFDGVITARNVDVGALISTAGNGAGATTGGSGGSNGGVAGPTSGVGLFGIANNDSVKISLAVPETFAPSVRSGGQARVTVRELPGRVFTGTISLVSGAIDPTSRTLEAQVSLGNPDHSLLPGMYARVQITPENPPSSLRIPAAALMIDADGTRVAVVGPGDRIHFEQVLTGRDFGTEMEVRRGVSENDRLVSSPSSQLNEGDPVKVVAAPPTPARAGSGRNGPAIRSNDPDAGGIIQEEPGAPERTGGRNAPSPGAVPTPAAPATPPANPGSSGLPVIRSRPAGQEPPAPGGSVNGRTGFPYTMPGPDAGSGAAANQPAANPAGSNGTPAIR